MKIKIVISIFSCMMLLCACPESVDQITIYNDSNQDISVYLGMGNGGTIYPDTSLTSFKVHIKVDKGKFYIYGTPLLDDLYMSEQVDYLCFFILATDTINKYDWDVVKNEYKILKRYDLSLQDIKQLKYTIHYPPNEAMKNIKMFPAYGK